MREAESEFEVDSEIGFVFVGGFVPVAVEVWAPDCDEDEVFDLLDVVETVLLFDSD